MKDNLRLLLSPPLTMTQIKHIIITKIRFNIVKLILILTKIIILFKYRQINIDLNKMSSLILIFKKLMLKWDSYFNIILLCLSISYPYAFFLKS